MKSIRAENQKIHFLNFEFNYDNRVVKHNGKVIQLVRKEADVLALLCEKAPDPVTPTDFSTEVWGGRYVTSQSIAQVIRSLRLKLADQKKDIIVTIPKLGYKLLPDVVSDTPEKYEITSNNFTEYQESSLMKSIVARRVTSGGELDAVINQIKELQNLTVLKILKLEEQIRRAFDHAERK